MNGELLQLFRDNLTTTAESASNWFCNESTIQTRTVYEERIERDDDRAGIVYLFGKGRKIFYIGETSRRIKERVRYRTAPHIDADWWNKWEYLKFLQVSDRTDRMTLELLLILALNPQANVKPRYREIAQMFMP